MKQAVEQANNSTGLTDMVERRLRGEPLQYILGKSDVVFFDFHSSLSTRCSIFRYTTIWFTRLACSTAHSYTPS